MKEGGRKKIQRAKGQILFFPSFTVNHCELVTTVNVKENRPLVQFSSALLKKKKRHTQRVALQSNKTHIVFDCEVLTRLHSLSR